MKFQIIKQVYALELLEEVCTTDSYGQEVCAIPLVGLETVFANIIEVILGLAAIALFLMLVVGGFKYITSGGDPKSVESAKNTLTYAIFGMVLLASAFLILRFIGVFTGADVENFRVLIP
jgi:hypothetical protein